MSHFDTLWTKLDQQNGLEHFRYIYYKFDNFYTFLFAFETKILIMKKYLTWLKFNQELIYIEP